MPGYESPQRRSSVLHDQIQSVSDLVRMFVGDVLGILIPGMVFTVAVFAVLASSVVCFLGPFDDGGQYKEVFKAILKSPIHALHIWLLVLLGYVLGSTFFRQDPKRPDQKSLERILRDWTTDELDRSELPRMDDVDNEEKAKEKKHKPSWRWKLRLWFLGRIDAVNPMRKKETLGREKAARIAASSGAQFPYSNIAAYLEARGYNHLAKIVPWSGSTFEHRSKMFINILKVRLELVAPSKCSVIVGNEAHIRMMSSVWYASKTLFAVCLLSTIPVFTHFQSLMLACKAYFQHASGWGSPVTLSKYEQLLFHDFLIYMVLFSFTAITAFWVKRHVERCFHYQRVREVVYVLETAFSVDKILNLNRFGDPDILKYLPPKQPEPSHGEKRDGKAVPSEPTNSHLPAAPLPDVQVCNVTSGGCDSTPTVGVGVVSTNI